MRLVRGLTRSLLFPVLAFLSLLPVEAQEAPSPPRAPVLELGERAVTVHNVSPGGDVVLFGLAHETRQFITTIVRREQILRDLDGDGSEAFELDQPLAARSLWAAVDFETGGVAVVAPDTFPLRDLGLGPGVIPAALDGLELPLPMAEILLVRPGVGVWGRRAGDGGASDSDGETDGTIRVRLAGMWNVAEGPPAPERLAPGDLIVVIDPYAPSVAVVRPQDPSETTS